MDPSFLSQLSGSVNNIAISGSNKSQGGYTVIHINSVIEVISSGRDGAVPCPRTPGNQSRRFPPSRLRFGFVRPLVSPTRKLASTHPSLFSLFGRETVPAQSSTGFLAQYPRLFPRGLQAGIHPAQYEMPSNYCPRFPLFINYVINVETKRADRDKIASLHECCS